MMNTRALVLGLVTLGVIIDTPVAQEFDERSIPEPSKLTRLALNAGTDVHTIGRAAVVESLEAAANVAAVQLRTPDGTSHSGLRVELRTAADSELLYIDAAEAAQLRNEFASLKSPSPCEATSMCVMGVARCRPSQAVRQAFCPGAYATPQGEHGVLMSGSKASFRFPTVSPAEFSAAIDAAIAQLPAKPPQ